MEGWKWEDSKNGGSSTLPVFQPSSKVEIRFLILLNLAYSKDGGCAKFYQLSLVT